MEAQELRNVAYRGPLNELINDLSANEILRAQLKIKDDKKSPAYQKMQDAEYVLRFLMLMHRWDKFTGDYREEMDTFMKENRNLEAEELNKHRQAFTTSITTCSRIWGDHLFKRPQQDIWRDQFLSGMYDAQMLAVNLLNAEEKEAAAARAEEILIGTRELFQDRTFDESVRLGTNTPSRLIYRVLETHKLLVGAEGE